MSTAKNGLDTGLVRELASILRDADLGEVEVEHEGLRIRVSKSAPDAPIHYAAPPMPAPAAHAPAPAHPAAAPAAPAEPAAASYDNAVTSPMVGTVFMLAPPPSTCASATGSA